MPSHLFSILASVGLLMGVEAVEAKRIVWLRAARLRLLRAIEVRNMAGDWEWRVLRRESEVGSAVDEYV